MSFFPPTVTMIVFKLQFSMENLCAAWAQLDWRYALRQCVDHWYCMAAIVVVVRNVESRVLDHKNCAWNEKLKVANGACVVSEVPIVSI